jgi:hypothetical protein
MLTKILGYSHEEMSTTKFTDRTHPDDIDKDVELRENLSGAKLKHLRFKNAIYIN